MYIEPKNSGCCHGKRNTDFNFNYWSCHLWGAKYRNTTSNDCSRNYQLVRSINRWCLIGDRDQLYNTKYRNNDDILCRSNK